MNTGRLHINEDLWEACEKGWNKKAERLLEEGADPNSVKSTKGWWEICPVIFRAIVKNRKKVVDVLLKHGANCMYRSTSNVTLRCT